MEKKDYIILSLIDNLSEIYSYNFNLEKEFIKNQILLRLKKYVKLDKINNNKLLTFMDDIIPNNIKNKNIVTLSKSKNIELIGNGGFSNVYKAYNNLDQQYYALKKIGIRNNLKNSLEEVRSMAKLNHTNIVRYHISWLESVPLNNKLTNNDLNLLSSGEDEYIESNYNQFIIIQMELCTTTLKNILKNKLKLFNKKDICTDIISGLQYIHKNNVIHRDLKPSNILLGKDGKFKIGDFGLATTLYNINTDDSMGTIGYMAPETLTNGEYSFKSDIYSIGIIILEIYNNFNTVMEKIECIKNIKLNKTIKNINNIQLVKSILNERISLDKILNIFNVV